MFIDIYICGDGDGGVVLMGESVVVLLVVLYKVIELFCCLIFEDLRSFRSRFNFINDIAL